MSDESPCSSGVERGHFQAGAAGVAGSRVNVGAKTVGTVVAVVKFIADSAVEVLGTEATGFIQPQAIRAASKIIRIGKRAFMFLIVANYRADWCRKPDLKRGFQSRENDDRDTRIGLTPPVRCLGGLLAYSTLTVLFH
ncbi:MAG: hypothetical protein NTZ74_04435 [Chloroflexi bacterium]|nr:hypothetical protein [Chloroflexota bacterium]